MIAFVIDNYTWLYLNINKYTKLNQSENEKSRNLEQMRALDNNIDIHVAFTSSIPLSVDTEDELVEIKKLMEYKS